VISVFPNQGRKLHTTRSWQFVGLAGPGGVPHGGAWRKAKFGADTIIGNFDTGELSYPAPPLAVPSSPRRQQSFSRQQLGDKMLCPARYGLVRSYVILID
jgi:hypothetical protein